MFQSLADTVDTVIKIVAVCISQHVIVCKDVLSDRFCAAKIIRRIRYVDIFAVGDQLVVYFGDFARRKRKLVREHGRLIPKIKIGMVGKVANRVLVRRCLIIQTQFVVVGQSDG